MDSARRIPFCIQASQAACKLSVQKEVGQAHCANSWSDGGRSFFFRWPRDVPQTGTEGAAQILWRFGPPFCQLGDNTKRFQQSTWLNQR